MRSKTRDWYECKYRYEKVQENGSHKTVTELYVVEAVSFSEAERRIIREMAAYNQGEYTVQNITPAVYHEVLFSESSEADKYYKTRVAFITLDENTGREKKSYVTYLVQASSTAEAETCVKEYFSGSCIDYQVQSVRETQVVDLFEEEKDDGSGAESRI